MSKLVEKYNYLKEAADLTVSESLDYKGLSEDILTRVVIETLKKYQNKINVGIQDSVSDILSDFKQKILESILNASKGWRLANRDGFIFPRGCRFCFTKGASTVFLIEQDPQIRSLLFDSSMLGERFNPTSINSAERIAISLPYTIFLVHYRNSNFSNLYCGWRTRPLSQLNDTLALPILPNIHDNMSVCMGHIKECDRNTESIISHFWNSRFNNDISNRWWSKISIDFRLSSARVWRENSLEDSTFVLNLDFPSRKTVKELIDFVTSQEEEPDENTFRHNFSEIVDNTFETLFAKIMNYFKKTKFERYYPNQIDELVQLAFKDANREYSDLLLAIQHEIDKLKDEISKDKKSDCVLEPGPYWTDYAKEFAQQ